MVFQCIRVRSHCTLADRHTVLCGEYTDTQASLDKTHNQSQNINKTIWVIQCEALKNILDCRNRQCSCNINGKARYTGKNGFKSHCRFKIIAYSCMLILFQVSFYYVKPHCHRKQLQLFFVAIQIQLKFLESKLNACYNISNLMYCTVLGTICNSFFRVD